jgi:quercetin dioxygenase-like cupin family protein
MPRKNDTIAPSTVETLDTLVQVADAAIVSRTLHRNAGGSVTLFAFDEGQHLTEHTSPYDALVQLLEGQLEITIGGEAVQLGAGQIVLMPANVPHGLRCTEPAKMLLVMLRPGSDEKDQ